MRLDKERPSRERGGGAARNLQQFGSGDNRRAEELRKLADFREMLYQRGLGHRKDSMFELADAVLVSERAQPLVRLSLEPVFRRRWSSAPDALADGQVKVGEIRALIHHHLGAGAATPVAGRAVWAVPERTFGHRPTAGIPDSGVVPGWEYQWLVEVPEARGSWIRPLDVARRRPVGGTPTQLAREQVRTALRARPAGAPRPVVTFDSGYDPVELARAVQHPDPVERLECDIIVRLPLRRRFYRTPPPYAGRGAPRKHGDVFHLKKPETHGPPGFSVTASDPEHGQVQVDVWENLHDQSAAGTALTLVRVQVERLPHSGRRPKPLWPKPLWPKPLWPKPLWLTWIARDRPADWLDVWHLYQRRFASEHGFRFLKHDLGWTTVRLRSPEAADRWSWLLLVALCRPLAALARPRPRRRPAPALGAPPAARAFVPRPGAPHLRPPFAGTGLPRRRRCARAEKPPAAAPAPVRGPGPTTRSSIAAPKPPRP